MVLMQRPDGGRTWVHESRVEEYQGRGFRFPAPPAPPEPAPKAEKPTEKKRTTKKK